MKKRVAKPILVGTVRIKVKGLQPVEKTKTGWKKSKLKFPEINRIVKLYKAQKNFKILVDKKNPQFLKGQLSPKKEPQGARINVLPDNQVLDKAFCLFGENLTLHDEHSHDHWDVLYQNKGGTWSYCYTLEKKQKNRNKKYKKVEQFAKLYSKLQRNVSLALKKGDFMALPMFTLLKTCMRVGNEVYYRNNKHKGLTTLKKKNLWVKGNTVTFDYIAKDGVPVTIIENFPEIYVQRLKNVLKKKKENDFVFTLDGKLLKEKHFKKAFLQYCGQEFYPHIVRSYYATKEMKKFLQNNKKVSKDKAKSICLSIAEKLGHKRFCQKDNEWKDSYTVTMNNYIQPKLVEQLKKRTV